MGQAKQKLKIQVDLKKMRADRANRFVAVLPSVPIRIIKALSAAIGFLPLTMICFAAVCFRQNKWPWDKSL